MDNTGVDAGLHRFWLFPESQAAARAQFRDGETLPTVLWKFSLYLVGPHFSESLQMADKSPKNEDVSCEI